MQFKVTFILIFCLLFSHAEESLVEYINYSNTEYHKFRDEVKNEKLKGAWVGDDFIFEWDEAGKKVFYSTNAKGKKKLAFDQEVLALEILKITKKKVNADGLPIQEFRRGKNGLEMRISNRWYGWGDQKLSKVKQGKRKRSGQRRGGSPDGKWRVRVEGAKLFLEEVGKDKKLLMDGDVEKETFRDVTWAPDSKKFVVGKVTKGQGRKVRLIESSPKDQLQPKLHEFSYDKPGDVISVARPGVFFVDGSEAFASDDSFLNP